MSETLESVATEVDQRQLAEQLQLVMRAPSGKAIRPPSPPGSEEADGADAPAE